jgi:acetyltransferase-like isoleucine patch superfamily enzyme
MPLVRATISIGDDVWIAADAFVGPGVTVGTGAILGARGVAMRDLAPWKIYAGKPCLCESARLTRGRDDVSLIAHDPARANLDGRAILALRHDDAPLQHAHEVD